MRLMAAAVILVAVTATLMGPRPTQGFELPDFWPGASPTSSPTAAPTATDTASPTPTATPTAAPVTPGRTRTPVPPTPPPPQLVRLSGTAMRTDGKPAVGVGVTAYRADDGAWAGAGSTNSSGAFAVSVAKNTAYKLFFSGSTVVARWYVNATTFAAANRISVGPVDTSGITIVLPVR